MSDKVEEEPNKNYKLFYQNDEILIFLRAENEEE